ncbi:MAG: T9SS type A sorting domain-containing protein [Bacteroidota bacterium]
MGKRYFLMLLLIIACRFLYAVNFIVCLAGDTMANGTYIEQGINEGYPYYKMGNYIMAYTNNIGCTQKWVILKDSTDMIYKNYEVSFEPPMHNWQTTCSMNSIYPAPEVYPEAPVIFYNYSYIYYYEMPDNDGSIDNSTPLIMTLNHYGGEEFSGNTGEDFYTNGKVNFWNVPAGLSPVLEKVNDTTLVLTFSGNAVNHNTSNSQWVDFEFNDAAFTGNNANEVYNSIYSNLRIQFRQPGINYYNTVFYESTANDGTINNNPPCTIKLNPLGGETFTGYIGENFFATGKATITGVPDNLVPELELANDTLLYLRLLDTALSHGSADDVIGISISFLDDAFSVNPAADILQSTYSYLRIDFFQLVYADLIPTDDHMVVFPNPCSKVVTVSVPSRKTNEVWSYRIIRMDGKIVFLGTFCESVIKMDVEDLEPGLYTLFIWSAHKSCTEKLVVR